MKPFDKVLEAILGVAGAVLGVAEPLIGARQYKPAIMTR